MVTISLPREYGYVVAVAVCFWVQQLLFALAVGWQRHQTGIKAPVLYPNDKLVTSLKLSPAQVDLYMRVQRVHQNNMEFLVMFFPMLLLAGLQNPTHAGAAGALCLFGRFAASIGYYISASARSVGAWFHIPEIYIVYLVCLLAYNLQFK